MIDIATIEVMIEQMLEGDYSVFETTKTIINADMTKEETDKIFKLFTEAYNSLELQNVTDIQISLALYSIDCTESMQKFFKWVNDRLEKVVKKEWTLQKFLEVWDKNYTSIHIKMGDKDLGTKNRMAIANIVYFINDLKE